MAADGGYASRDNLNQAKARGVKDVAFHKKRGLAVADMTKSAWVYRKLRNFRAGIEAGISCFKRAYGGRRCTPAFAGAGSGAGSTTSRPTSGLPWSPTTSCCSPASNRDRARPLQQHRSGDQLNPADLACTLTESPKSAATPARNATRATQTKAAFSLLLS